CTEGLPRCPAGRLPRGARGCPGAKYPLHGEDPPQPPRFNPRRGVPARATHARPPPSARRTPAQDGHPDDGREGYPDAPGRLELGHADGPPDGAVPEQGARIPEGGRETPIPDAGGDRSSTRRPP